MIQPKMSKWGEVQSCDVIVRDNIFYVGTASHGGFILSSKYNKKIPDWLRTKDRCYEEDCEWSIVVCCLPELFDKKTQENAKNIMRNCYWKEYEKMYKELIPEGNSRSKDEYFWKIKNYNKWQVLSAFSHDHPTVKNIGVPSNMTVVYAYRGGRPKNGFINDKEAKWFLIPKDIYNSRLAWDDNDYTKLNLNI